MNDYESKQSEIQRFTTEARQDIKESMDPKRPAVEWSVRVHDHGTPWHETVLVKATCAKEAGLRALATPLRVQASRVGRTFRTGN